MRDLSNFVRGGFFAVVIATGWVACSSNGSDAGDGGPCRAGMLTSSGQCMAKEGGVDAPKPVPAECGAPDAGAASLASLTVTSSSDAKIALVPAFAPGITDYYVRCASGATSLTVDAKALGGGSVALGLETPGLPTGTTAAMGAAAPEQSTTLSVTEGQALVLTSTVGAASQEYWVRCLPSAIPTIEWTPHAGGCSRTPGYYLVGVLAPGGYATAFDNDGVPVWFKYNGGDTVYDVDSLATGDVSFAGPWQLDYLGKSTLAVSVDAYDGGTPSTPDSHELQVLPNGHFMALASPSALADLTGLTLPSPGGTMSYGPGTTILECEVQEFDATGKVYWEWKATDHFNPETAMVVQGDGDLGSNSYVEPFHCNSIDVDPATGDILVSARHMNSVFYIEKATGKVLWKMGGSACSVTSGNGSPACFDDPPPTYVPVADPFVCQHDARLQPGWKETCSGGSGQISVFDDESYTKNAARGAVYDVNVAGGCTGGGGTTSGATAGSLSWQYKNTAQGGVPSATCGSLRLATDGTRLIGWGQSFVNDGYVFTEVDEKGDDLLDLYWPGNYSYRAIKAPLTQFDLATLRATAGQ